MDHTSVEVIGGLLVLACLVLLLIGGGGLLFSVAMPWWGYFLTAGLAGLVLVAVVIGLNE